MLKRNGGAERPLSLPHRFYIAPLVLVRRCWGSLTAHHSSPTTRLSATTSIRTLARQDLMVGGPCVAFLSHHHYFPKAVAEDSHVFKGIFMVLMIEWRYF